MRAEARGEALAEAVIRLRAQLGLVATVATVVVATVAAEATVIVATAAVA
jgi:hypothetical protein